MKFIALIDFRHDTFGHYQKGDEWRGSVSEGKRLQGGGYLSESDAPNVAVAPTTEPAKPRKGKGA